MTRLISLESFFLLASQIFRMIISGAILYSQEHYSITIAFGFRDINSARKKVRRKVELREMTELIEEMAGKCKCKIIGDCWKDYIPVCSSGLFF